MKKIIIISISIIIVLLFIFVLKQPKDTMDKGLPIFSPKFFNGFDPNKDKQNPNHKVGDFVFRNQFDRKIKSNILDDHITIVSFFYSSCQLICPTIIKRLKEVNAHFNNNNVVQILSFSINPQIDTPDILNLFAREQYIHAPQWQLLTGSLDSLVSFATASFFSNASMKNGFEGNIHTETLFLVDSNRRIRGMYNSSVKRDIALLIEDIETLLEQ
tara:strand:+ start:46 stop:690 length:645 start_codon:yes stop_codon:yes gene_type:complete